MRPTTQKTLEATASVLKATLFLNGVSKGSLGAIAVGLAAGSAIGPVCLVVFAAAFCGANLAALALVENKLEKSKQLEPKQTKQAISDLAKQHADFFRSKE